MKRIYTVIAASLFMIGVNAQTFLSKDFEDQSLTSGGWTTQLVTGTLDWDVDQFGGNYFAVMNNYDGSNNNLAETWLISPAMDLSTANVPVLTFITMANFTGDSLEIYVSNDYDGTSAPSTATWNQLTAALSWTNYTPVPSGDIDITAYTGSAVYVAFKYVGTANDGKKWEVDDILVEETSATPPLNVSATTVDATCGNTDGSATLNVSGGTTPYTYAWSNGSTSSSVTGLAFGSYTVTVSDATPQSEMTTVMISNSNGPSLTVSVTDPTCHGDASGSATVTIASGSSTTYEWSEGTSTMTATGLTAGTYWVTVTESGCQAIASATVTNPGEIETSASVTNVTLDASSDGAINLTATGGNSGYTYVWSNAATTSNISNLTMGDYIVTVTDVNSCFVIDTVTVGSNEAPTLSIYDIQYTSNSNGTSPYDQMEVKTMGVVSGFSTWDHGSPTRNYRGYFIQNGDSAWSGLFVNDTVNYNTVSPGDTVRVTGTIDDDKFPYWDYTMMKNITSFQVVSTGGPEPIPLSVSSLDANEEKYEGLLIKVSGGDVVDLTDIAFGVWSINDGSGPVAVDDLIYGPPTDPSLGEKYDVTGVMFSEFNDIHILPRRSSDVVLSTDTISMLDISSSVVDATCGNSDGSATLTVSGGTSPYAYIWDNGLTSSSISGLAFGNYNVTISDATPQSQVTTIVINNSDGPTLSISVTDPICYGGADASASVTTSGSAVTYSWSEGSTTSIATGLSAGTYWVTVTESGCPATISAMITNPDQIQTGAIVTDVTLDASSDGAINLNPSNGNGNYTYQWDNNETSSNISNLTMGDYIVTVTDGNSCFVIDTITVGSNEAPTLSIYDIQYTSNSNGTSPYDQMEVKTMGVVTAFSTWDHGAPDRNYRGYFIQNGDSAWTGLYVNDTVNYIAVSPGDTVKVAGKIDDNHSTYWDYTAMINITSFEILSAGGPEPTPLSVTSLEANEEKYEGLLIKVGGGVVTDLTDIGFGAWTIDDGSGPILIDDIMYGHQPDPSMGEKYDVTGVMFSEFNDIKLLPRKSADVTFAVGIENNLNLNVVNVFPNPTSEVLHISSEDAIDNIRLYDYRGATIHSINNPVNDIVTMDVSSLSAGVYFIELTSTGTVSTTKVVIK